MIRDASGRCDVRHRAPALSIRGPRSSPPPELLRCGPTCAIISAPTQNGGSNRDTARLLRDPRACRRGGMGQVWRARDTRLDREVAIKVLPPDFSANAQFQARFERESKTISSLNHPHICTLGNFRRDASARSENAPLRVPSRYFTANATASASSRRSPATRRASRIFAPLM